MRAAYIEQTGPPEVIKVGDLPRPEPGPGQVLVRVHAVALNPIDLYIRSGLVAMPLVVPLRHRLRPGRHGRARSGRAARGSESATASGARTRDCSAARASPPNTPPSTKTGSTRRPHRSPDTEAAAMALVGITAHLGLFQFGQLKTGEIVYVPGGTGGVGSMVVQMAKAAGARVATVGGQPRTRRALPPARAPTSPSITRPTTSPPGSASSRPRASTSGTRPSASRTSRSPSPCSASTAG